MWKLYAQKATKRKCESTLRVSQWSNENVFWTQNKNEGWP